MADVAITFSILPEDSDSSVESIMKEIKEKLKNKCRISNIEPREIAFGLKKINLEVVIPDEEGQQDNIETLLREVNGVGQVDAEDMSLV
jgi:translation elongation factor aEF-1 beta